MEAQDDKYALQLLVGDYFGDRPEEKLDTIRIAKKNRAAYLCKKMGCNKESVMLEIGSGMGFTSKHVAEEVKHLYCSDISASLLDIAKKECLGISNIEFMKIEKQPATFSFQDEFFDFIYADAVFIHLNLYDIFWYFSEFQRLAKKARQSLHQYIGCLKDGYKEVVSNGRFLSKRPRQPGKAALLEFSGRCRRHCCKFRI